MSTDTAISEKPSADTFSWTAACFQALMIVFIVVGHINPAGFDGPFNLFPLYSFHVAAFGFVSGYLYSARHDAKPIGWVMGRVKRLVVPMFAFYFLYGLLTTVLRMAFGFGYGAPLNLRSLLFDTLFNGHQFDMNYGMWFLAPFFIAQVVWMLTRWMVSRVRLNGSASDVLTSLACIALGSVSFVLGGSEGLPAGALLLVARSLFLLFGIGLGRAWLVMEPRLTGIPLSVKMAAVVLAQLAIQYLGYGSVSYTPSWVIFPRGGVLAAAATVTGILFWWLACDAISTHLQPRAKQAIKMLSGNTFSIMCHHIFAFWLLKLLFCAASLFTPLFGQFDTEAFMSNITYVYYPHGSAQFAILYVACGIVVPLLMHSAWAAIRAVVMPHHGENETKG